jgi:hypothetical protein
MIRFPQWLTWGFIYNTLALFDNYLSVGQAVPSKSRDGPGLSVHAPDTVLLDVGDVQVAVAVNRDPRRINVGANCWPAITGKTIVPGSGNGLDNPTGRVDSANFERPVLNDKKVSCRVCGYCIGVRDARCDSEAGVTRGNLASVSGNRGDDASVRIYAAIL